MPVQTQYEKQLEESRQVWNKAADSFENEPDHDLRDEAIRTACTALLRSHLPSAPPNLLDLGYR